MKKLKNSLTEFYSYRYLLRELTIKGIKLKYRRSYLGLFWSLLEPLLNMLVLTFVFGTLFGNTDKTYPVYILAGRLIWTCFSTSTKTGLRSIRSNSGLINKVYVPKYLYPMSGVLYSYVIFLLSLIDLFIVAPILGVPITKYYLLVFVPLILVLLLSYGVGLILATLNVYFRDIEYLYDVFLTLLMYLCAIFYYPERFINNGLGWVLEVNPIYCIIACFRSCVFGEAMNPTYIIVAALWSVVTIAFGTWLFNRKQDDFVLHI